MFRPRLSVLSLPVVATRGLREAMGKRVRDKMDEVLQRATRYREYVVEGGWISARLAKGEIKCSVLPSGYRISYRWDALVTTAYNTLTRDEASKYLVILISFDS